MFTIYVLIAVVIFVVAVQNPPETRYPWPMLLVGSTLWPLSFMICVLGAIVMALSNEK